MDELLLEIATNAPTIAILLAWVWAERRDRKEAMAFYRAQLVDCQNMIGSALSRHIDAEQVK